MLNITKPHGLPEDPYGSWAGLVGIPCTVIGIPEWTVGGSRKAKVELALKKINIVPENSMALD